MLERLVPMTEATGQHPYHDQRLTVADGTEIAWSRRGSGAPIVLVHGITENAQSFEPITNRLVESHEVITLDLRGHGESGQAETYDLAAMAGDVVGVAAAAGVEAPTYIGHSLGGAVVTAVGAVAPYQSIICIDQSLQLDGFKDMLAPAEPMLRDAESFPMVIQAMFADMAGPLPAEEFARVEKLRHANQSVVLGVWELILSEPVEAIAAVVDEALAGYQRLAGGEAPRYLALFGSDPGDAAAWLGDRIPGSEVILWADTGHYPHLLRPDDFIDLVRG